VSGKDNCLTSRTLHKVQTRLSIWEDSREKHRRRLLVEEAEDKQRDGVWIDEKRGFLDKLAMR
jgi:hypothetical protein